MVCLQAQENRAARPTARMGVDVICTRNKMP
jgi:hypothetical protein